MGILALARLARNSRRFLRRARIRRTNFRERSGAPCFREICFSGATENVVAQATRSRRRADVRFGFDSLRRDSRQMPTPIIWRSAQKPSSIRNCGPARAKRGSEFWGAHASRVLASASRDRELSFEIVNALGGAAEKQDCFGVTPKPARETRALPRLCEHARSYSPSRLQNCARAYSRLSFAMKLALILAGHTASHS